MTLVEETSSVSTIVPAEVRLQDDAGREFIIIGVGQIGLESQKPASELVKQALPDSVCVDLDVARAKILANEDHWETLSIRGVIKEKLGTALLLNLLLAAYLRKVDDTSGFMPGGEHYEAIQAAEALSLPVTLTERGLNVTFNRAWRSLNYREKFHLLQMAIRRLFRFQKVSEEAAAELRQTDVLSAFIDEVTQLQPVLKETLIDERDQYTVQKMMAAPGKKIASVAGAGRLKGLQQVFLQDPESSLAELEEVAETSAVKKWISRLIPVLLLLIILYIGWSQGADFIRENLVFWILANSLFTGIGAILAGGHILTVLVAMLVAPISPLIPAGPGTVAAIVQAIIRPPLVKDFQTFADDVTQIRHWRRNRIMRIFLVLILCGLGSLIGTLLGTSRIIWSFLGLR